MLADIEQAFAEAEVKRLGIKPISGSSDAPLILEHEYQNTLKVLATLYAEQLQRTSSTLLTLDSLLGVLHHYAKDYPFTGTHWLRTLQPMLEELVRTPQQRLKKRLARYLVIYVHDLWLKAQVIPDGRPPSIRGGSGNDQEYYHGFDWIERRSRFTVIRGLLWEMRIIRMTGSQLLIHQLANDILHVVMQERDEERIWQAEQLLLFPLRQFLDDPESTALFHHLYAGYKQLWSYERKRYRESQKGDE